MSTLTNLATMTTSIGSLMLGRFRRRPTEAPDTAPAAPPTNEPCRVSGCGEQTSWQCMYWNETGQRCGTHWCLNHVIVVGGETYCKRHAGVSVTLNQTEGSIYQVKGHPSLEDRAVSLLELIRQNLDPQVHAMLVEASRGLKGVEISGQKSVQPVQSGSDRTGWQVSWGLFNSRGYVLRTFIRVGVAEPPVVQAFVEHAKVFQGTPYWIARRLNGEPPTPADHQQFYVHLTQAMQDAVAASAAQLADKLEFEAKKFGAKTRRY